jgi:RNA polymerase sigma factor (sigma-70 family)
LLDDLYREHWLGIKLMAAVRVGDHRDAEDIAQEVFERFGKALLRGAEIVNVWAYLLAVLRSVVADHYNSVKRTPPADREPEEHDASVTYDYEEAFGGDPALLGALSELSTRQREVVILTVVLGMKPGEASKVLVDVTPERVSNYKEKALRRLRTLVDRRSGQAS